MKNKDYKCIKYETYHNNSFTIGCEPFGRLTLFQTIPTFKFILLIFLIPPTSQIMAFVWKSAVPHSATPAKHRQFPLAIKVPLILVNSYLLFVPAFFNAYEGTSCTDFPIHRSFFFHKFNIFSQYDFERIMFCN